VARAEAVLKARPRVLMPLRDRYSLATALLPLVLACSAPEPDVAPLVEPRRSELLHLLGVESLVAGSRCDDAVLAPLTRGLREETSETLHPGRRVFTAGDLDRHFLLLTCDGQHVTQQSAMLYHEELATSEALCLEARRLLIERLGPPALDLVRPSLATALRSRWVLSEWESLRGVLWDTGESDVLLGCNRIANHRGLYLVTLGQRTRDRWVVRPEVGQRPGDRVPKATPLGSATVR